VQELLEPPDAVGLAFEIRAFQRVECLVLFADRIAEVPQRGVFDVAHALCGFIGAGTARVIP